jgi:hypothetical protein
MTTFENPSTILNEQLRPGSSRPRRPRLSRAERAAAGAAAAGVAGFAGYGFATHSPSTIGYVSSVLVVAAAVVGLRRVVLPPLLAAGLAIAAIVTLAGGLIKVGHDVLGLGALNEMVEFIATLAHHGAHAGGYWNTGWDLVANFAGATAAGLVLVRSRVGAA